MSRILTGGLETISVRNNWDAISIWHLNQAVSRKEDPRCVTSPDARLTGMGRSPGEGLGTMSSWKHLREEGQHFAKKHRVGAKRALVGVLIAAMTISTMNVPAIAEELGITADAQEQIIQDSTVNTENQSATAEGTPAEGTDATVDEGDDPADTSADAATDTTADTQPADDQQPDEAAGTESDQNNLTGGGSSENDPAAVEEDTTAQVAVKVANASLKYTDANGAEQTVSENKDAVDFPTQTEIKFSVTANDGFQASRVFYTVDGADTDVAADESGTYTIPAEAVNDGLAITVETAEIPAADEPAVDDAAGEAGQPAADEGEQEASLGEEAPQAQSYKLNLSHRLDVKGGYYETTESVEVQPSDITDGVYDPTSHALALQGINFVSAQQVSVSDFEDDGVASATLTYEIDDDYQINPLAEGTEGNYVLIGDLVDIDIEPASQKFVTVRFQYENGATQAQPYSEAVRKSEDGKFHFDYSYRAPEGFSVKSVLGADWDESAGTITRTYDNADPAEIVVTLTGVEASYAVKYLFEGLDGDYAEDPDHTQESKTGIVGTLTEAAASQVEGFTPQQIVQQEIKADGSTVVEVKYARNSYTLMYDTRGGTYVASVTAKYGETVELASGDDVPTRQGYKFDGWYSDADLTTPVDKVTISENTTVYAKWDGIIVNYKVVYMTENADDDNYSYAGTVELNAKAGTEVTADASTRKPSGFDNDHFKFESSSSATVAADGSTVITVKYSRNEYTWTFEGTAGYDCGKEGHTHNWWCENFGCGKEAHTHSRQECGWHDDITITAKYQADISDQWREKISPLGKYWYWDNGYTGFQTTMMGDRTISDFVTGTARHTLTYYVEDPNGNIPDPNRWSDRKFSEYTSFTISIPGSYTPTFNEEFFQIDGYSRYTSTIDAWENVYGNDW